MRCWICGSIANSGEHKIKKSSLLKMYKNEFNDKSMYHYNGNNDTFCKIPGANSKKLKYLNTLCSDCNNAKTQDFDLAYDTFFNYCIANREIILEKRVIDFFDIYGDEFPTSQTNLFKYFVKLLGCAIHASGHIVPSDLIDLLDRKLFKTGLALSFTINESEISFEKETTVCKMGIGKLVTTQENLKLKNIPLYKWSTFFSYMQINYWYLTRINGPFGAPWIADSRYLYLGYTNQQLEEERTTII